MIRGPVDRHTLYGLGAILLWSATVAMARSLSEQVGSFSAAAAVYLSGGVLLSVQGWLSRRGREGARQALSPEYLLGCGALFCGYMISLYLAIGLAADRRQTLEVGLLNYLWPATTILFSLLFLGKRARWTLVPGTLIALAGVALVLTQDTALSWPAFADNVRGNAPAYAFGLAAGVSWGLYSTLARRWNPSGRGAVSWFMLVTGLAFLLLRALRGETPPGCSEAWTVRAGFEVAAMVLANSTAYTLWDAAMRRGNVLLVAAASYSTPLLSTLVSSLYLGIVPGPRLWWGCACLIAGSLISWRSVSDAR